MRRPPLDRVVGPRGLPVQLETAAVGAGPGPLCPLVVRQWAHSQWAAGQGRTLVPERPLHAAAAAASHHGAQSLVEHVVQTPSSSPRKTTEQTPSQGWALADSGLWGHWGLQSPAQWVRRRLQAIPPQGSSRPAKAAQGKQCGRCMQVVRHSHRVQDTGVSGAVVVGILLRGGEGDGIL